METLSYILNAFTLMCLSTCFTEAQTDLSLRLFAESGQTRHLNPADLHHQRARRQTTDSTLSPEEIAYCGSLISNAYCSSGLAQGFIDADLSCGEGFERDHRRTANGCARSEKGEFCSSAFTLFDLGGIGRRNIEGNCSGVLQTNSCPSACRTSLETFKSKLGCCINTLPYVNGTIRNIIRISSESAVDYRDYRVWQLCGVTLPAADCGNSLDITPPATVDSCSPREIFERGITRNFCLPSRGQPYVNALLDERCSQTEFFNFAEYVVNLCSMNDDAFSCGLLDNELNYGYRVDININRLDSICAGSNVTCTPECRDTLRNATINHGCCVNFFNTTAFGPRPLSLSYDVWRSCGVESPGFCESTLSLNGAMPNDTSSQNYAMSTVTGGLWMNITLIFTIVIGAMASQ